MRKREHELPGQCVGLADGDSVQTDPGVPVEAGVRLADTGVNAGWQASLAEEPVQHERSRQAVTRTVETAHQPRHEASRAVRARKRPGAGRRLEPANQPGQRAGPLTCLEYDHSGNGRQQHAGVLEGVSPAEDT